MGWKWNGNVLYCLLECFVLICFGENFRENIYSFNWDGEGYDMWGSEDCWDILFVLVYKGWG